MVNFFSNRDKAAIYNINEKTSLEKKNLFKKYFNLFNATYIYYKNKLTSKIIIPYVELVITTKCNLRCKDCSHLINYYYQGNNSPYEIPSDVLLSDFNKLINAVDYIYTITLMGGEPFLYRNLNVLIDEISKSDKIGKINIITNGVTSPNKNVLNSLKNDKVLIKFSDYSINPKKTEKIKNLFNDKNINYLIMDFAEWYDLGDFEYRNRTNKEKKETFKQCSTSMCNSILNGKLFICPRASHSQDLGLLKNSSYVNLRDNVPSDVLKDNILHFLSEDNHIECDYCNGDFIKLKENKAIQE